MHSTSGRHSSSARVVQGFVPQVGQRMDYTVWVEEGTPREASEFSK